MTVITTAGGSVAAGCRGAHLMNPTGLEGIGVNFSLRQVSEQPEHYDSSVLVGSLARAARSVEGLMPPNLKGTDLWNCWEVSWLDLQGKPVMRIGQLVIPASSPNLTESKSLKLYLNSFANEKLRVRNAVISRSA